MKIADTPTWAAGFHDWWTSTESVSESIARKGAALADTVAAVLRVDVVRELAALPEDASFADRLEPVVAYGCKVAEMAFLARRLLSASRGMQAAASSASRTLEKMGQQMPAAWAAGLGDGGAGLPQGMRLNLSVKGKGPVVPEGPARTATQLSGKLSKLRDAEKTTPRNVAKLREEFDATKAELADMKPQLVENIRKTESELAVSRKMLAQYQAKAANPNVIEIGQERLARLIERCATRIELLESRMHNLVNALAEIP